MRNWLGVDARHVSHAERWVAAMGAFAGILATAWISSRYLSVGDSWLMVGSMGASAVLLFAVPHGQLSQPWAATGGQLISAAVGVTCAEWIPVPVLAAARLAPTFPTRRIRRLARRVAPSRSAPGSRNERRVGGARGSPTASLPRG